MSDPEAGPVTVPFPKTTRGAWCPGGLTLRDHTGEVVATAANVTDGWTYAHGWWTILPRRKGSKSGDALSHTDAQLYCEYELDRLGVPFNVRPPTIKPDECENLIRGMDRYLSGLELEIARGKALVGANTENLRRLRDRINALLKEDE